MVLAFLMSNAIDDFTFDIPVVQLIVVLILSGAVGVLAAILPARRASNLNVLEALAYE